MRHPLVVWVLVTALAACMDATSYSTAEPTQTTSPAATSSPAPTTDHPTTDQGRDVLGELPIGPPPRIGYVDGRRFIWPDGRTARVPTRHGISAITPFADGFLVADTRYFEGSLGLAYFDGDRVYEDEPCSSGAPRLGLGGVVAWVTFACPESGQRFPTLIHRSSVEGGGVSQVEVERLGLISVAGVIGGEVVYNAAALGVRITTAGQPSRTLPGLGFVQSVDEIGHRVAGHAPDPRYRLAVVADAQSGRHMWRARGIDLEDFSPNGRLITATQLNRPLGPRGVRLILDAATGRRIAIIGVVEGAPYSRNWSSLTWEDQRHLVGVLEHRGRHALVRVDLQGRVSRIGPIVRADRSFQPRYLFAIRR